MAVIEVCIQGKFFISVKATEGAFKANSLSVRRLQSSNMVTVILRLLVGNRGNGVLLTWGSICVQTVYIADYITALAAHGCLRVELFVGMPALAFGF